jgi:hypothetical protein
MYGTTSSPLSYQVVKFNRPTLTFDEIELHRYNSVAWVAGKHKWNECTVTFEDDITGTASQVVQNQLTGQKRIIANDDGADGQFLPATATGSMYKFTATIEMLDGNQGVVETWTLQGAWIKEVNYGELDYNANEKVEITTTLRYDHAVQEINGTTSNIESTNATGSSSL